MPAAPAAPPVAPTPVPPAAPSPAPVELHAEPPATLPQAASPMWTTPSTSATSSSTADSSASGSSESSAGGGSEGATAGGASSLGGETGGESSRGARGAGDSVALGISGDDGGVYAGYIALLRRRVQDALTYPSAARRRGMAGTVQVDISVEPTGQISEVVVVRSSSHEILDGAALDAVRALRQIPFPPGVRPRAIRVRLPIVFELR
jgi:protein TonB